jgi:predicted transcriptional regulator
MRSGVSQRQLARWGGTAQSVIARIEAGQTSPTWETLSRLLNAMGFEPRLELEVCAATSSHMLEDVTRILGLSPEQRLRELRNAAEFFALARRC